MTILKTIAEAVKDKDLLSCRPVLENIFKKKDIDFGYDPVPHFRIKYQNKIILLAHKDKVDTTEETLISGKTNAIAIDFES